MSEKLLAVRSATKFEPDITVSEESDNDVGSSESEDSNQDITDEHVTSAGEDEAEIEEIPEENKSREKTKPVTELNSMEFVCTSLGDFTAEETDDLSFKKDESLKIIAVRADGWWEAENQFGQTGIVPSSYLKVPDEFKKYLDGNVMTSSGYEAGHLWEKLRSTVKQTRYVEEAITSMGAFPIGFCQATLKQLLNKDSKYTTEAFLAPKLNSSGLYFSNLHLSAKTKSLKPVTCNLQRCVRLVAFRQVPSPGPGFEISSHHVRICLHDGSKILSNIHTIRAKCDPKTPKIWSFSPKLPSNGSTLEEGFFFIRSNATSPTVGILFQLCVSFTKFATNESGEMSCGWVFTRLIDDSGLSVPKRASVLVHSGEPFMSKNSSPLNSGTKSGPFKIFSGRSKKPRLVLSVLIPKKKHEHLLNYMPSTFVGSVSSLPLFVLYKKILADKLLKERSTFNSTDIIQSPFLANFPKVFEFPDVVDAFRKYWSDKLEKIKSALKDEENKKMSFQQAFMETAFLLLHYTNLPSYILGNIQTEKERKIEILRIMKIIKDCGPFALAMSPEHNFNLISVKGLSLSIVGPYSVNIDDTE